MLERRASAGKVAEEIGRCKREQARHAKILQRQKDCLPASTAVGGEEGAAGSKQPRRNLKANKGGEGLSAMVSSATGLSELMEREGEQFGKLQAKTIEMQQRLALLEKQEAAMRANAARKAKAAKAALQEAAAKRKKLKEEAEQREVACTVSVCLESNAVALSGPIYLGQHLRKTPGIPRLTSLVTAKLLRRVFFSGLQMNIQLNVLELITKLSTVRRLLVAVPSGSLRPAGLGSQTSNGASGQSTRPPCRS